jgi:hypothetical protein
VFSVLNTGIHLLPRVLMYKCPFLLTVVFGGMYLGFLYRVLQGNDLRNILPSTQKVKILFSAETLLPMDKPVRCHNLQDRNMKFHPPSKSRNFITVGFYMCARGNRWL